MDHEVPDTFPTLPVTRPTLPPHPSRASEAPPNSKRGALQGLKRGQKILVEPELFHADSVSLYDEFDMLSDGSQKAFKHMAAHCQTAGFDEVTSIPPLSRHQALFLQ
ncbi:hypothetical protein PG984_013210 [Apiospora sp. TS-2023a]